MGRFIRVVALWCALSAPAFAQNHLMVEGVLRDNSGNALDGTFDLTFALYAASTGGSPVYSEAHPATVVSGGLFQERIGATTTLSAAVFASNAALWLGVTIAGQPELPRTPLETDPYAFRALTASLAGGLDCVACVDASQVAFPYAAAATAGGDAAVALLAKDVECTGCISADHLAAGAIEAADVTFDDSVTKLGATNVQSAIERLKALVGTGGASNVNEGNGTVIPYVSQWGLPSYGVATEYVHLMNPTKPKVIMWMYGGQSSGFSSSNNLIVSNSYVANKASGGASGNKGETSLQISNPAIFNTGDHILIHQTVAAAGAATPSGTWELNAIKAVTGNALSLARPLENTYVSNTSSGNAGTPRAQVVKAASYNILEVVNGGRVYPEQSYDGNVGGIVYVRAQNISVKTGGAIHADAFGYAATSCCYSSYGAQGMNECNATEWKGGTDAYCSGGGGSWGQNCSYCGDRNTGGGGGGNKTAGEAGYTNGSYQAGKGGAAKGTADAKQLHMGGAGGGTCSSGGGVGGGLVVLGAKTIIVESGGRVSASGQQAGGNNSCHYGGGGAGAGGSVALYADVIDVDGTVEAKGGARSPGYAGWYGGAGGEGWVFQKTPVAGIVNQSFATGVEISVDGVNITPSVGDPNAKGAPHWDATNKRWGATGTDAWSTGPLDLTNVVNWTLGEHRIDLKETGGAGGDLKSYIYVLYPFTASKPPANDTCAGAIALDAATAPVVVSGTTEDTMGKTRATDDHSIAGCGGAGGPDVVYKVEIPVRSLINAVLVAPFSAKLYLTKTSCTATSAVYCAAGSELSTHPLDPGTYYLWVDSDAAGAKGDFSLAVSTVPAPLPTHDTCAVPFVLTLSGTGTASHTSSSLYALDDYKGLCPAAKTGGPDVVYEVTAGTGQSITASVTAAFKPIIYIKASDCATGFPLTCSATGTATVQGVQGGKYWIVLDGEAEKEWGAYTLNVTVQ